MIYVFYFEAVRKAHVYKVANYGESYDTWAMHLQRIYVRGVQIEAAS
jgi:hypothetical protein